MYIVEAFARDCKCFSTPNLMCMSVFRYFGVGVCVSSKLFSQKLLVLHGLYVCMVCKLYSMFN